MKQGYLGILVAVLSIAMVVLFFRIGTLKNAIQEANHKTVEKKEVVGFEEKEEIELAVYMSRLQLYMNKLYFAGKAKNMKLSEFYIHELEETMEEIIEAEVMEDGVDISENMNGFGYKQIKLLDKELDTNEFTNFNDSYKNLITSCNGCHMVAKHNYIVIKEPTLPALDNQDFNPQP